MPKLPYFLSILLKPFATAYGKILERRRQSYKSGALQSYKSTCPVISVGNIAWGGTGKTPFVSHLLSWAEAKKLKAVVLTRGYGSAKKQQPLVIDPQSTTVELAGDEPLSLAKKHLNAKIISFPQRVKSALLAEQTLNPDLFILDDGMQHLQIQRDLNIVLLKPCDLSEQWDKVIPSGSWREGASALKSAQCFAMKVSTDEFAEIEPLVQEKLYKFNVPFFTFDLLPSYFVTIDDFIVGTYTPKPLLDYLKKGYILCTGVGNPEQIFKSITKFTKHAPTEHLVYKDHHKFTLGDIKKLTEQGLPIVCTEKDAVKLVNFKRYLNNHTLLVILAEVQFGKSLFTNSNFATMLETWWLQQQRNK